MEEINKKISEIREKRKLESLQRYEKDPELGKLIKQAELQLGVKLDITGEDMEHTLGINRQIEDEQADYQGALEFNPGTENPDDINIDTFGDY